MLLKSQHSIFFLVFHYFILLKEDIPLVSSSSPVLNCTTAGKGITGSKCGSCIGSLAPLSLPSSESSLQSLGLLCNFTEPKTLLPVPGKVLLGSTAK